ncbi:hypothetical protein ACIHAA_02725 [Streptomyces sp. NPDC052040]|uniref:hypothetical protein n=1 Tax=unclassified Streptomyces TaxID=2593676 RepID=UPI0037D7B66D
MLSLPLPLALTARLLPVAVLASAGWAMSSGPLAAAPATGQKSAQDSPAPQDTAGGSPGSPSPAASEAAVKAYAAAPAPCTALAKDTITSLVPGAKPDGKEIPSTDSALRRTCSWNALKGYDYRWLDVTFEIMDSAASAQKTYTQRTSEKSGGGPVPGLGDGGYSVVNLTTDDKQQTREGVVLIRSSNALVSVTYNGSDFETKKAPGTDEINKGAIKAARDAVTALENGKKQG